jgi:hypothetical protein
VDDEPKAVRVRGSSDRPWGPSVVVAAIVGFLVVAVVKPWSFGATVPEHPVTATSKAAPIATAAAVARTGPSPVPTLAITDPNAMACLSDETDQLVTIERWAGHEVRSWVAVSDLTGSGPLDRHLEPITIFSNHVVGLGVCAPLGRVNPSQQVEGGATRGTGPGATLLDVRSIVDSPAGRTAVDLGIPATMTIRSRGPDEAVLYGPPDGAGSAGGGPTRSSRPVGASQSAASGATSPVTASPGAASPIALSPAWEPGSYAIAFRFDSDGPAVVRWVRFDLMVAVGGEN